MEFPTPAGRPGPAGESGFFPAACVSTPNPAVSKPEIDRKRPLWSCDHTLGKAKAPPCCQRKHILELVVQEEIHIPRTPTQKYWAAPPLDGNGSSIGIDRPAKPCGPDRWLCQSVRNYGYHGNHIRLSTSGPTGNNYRKKLPHWPRYSSFPVSHTKLFRYAKMLSSFDFMIMMTVYSVTRKPDVVSVIPVIAQLLSRGFRYVDLCLDNYFWLYVYL